MRQAECFEHLHGATGDPVGLPHCERAVLAIDDRSTDVWKVTQLRGQNQTCGTATHDQHVDGVRKAFRTLRDRRMRVPD